MARILYHQGDGIMEIIIRDDTGAKIEHFRANLKDTAKQVEIFKIIKYKYGLNFSQDMFDF